MLLRDPKEIDHEEKKVDCDRSYTIKSYHYLPEIFLEKKNYVAAAKVLSTKKFEKKEPSFFDSMGPNSFDMIYHDKNMAAIDKIFNGLFVLMVAPIFFPLSGLYELTNQHDNEAKKGVFCNCGNCNYERKMKMSQIAIKVSLP